MPSECEQDTDRQGQHDAGQAHNKVQAETAEFVSGDLFKTKSAHQKVDDDDGIDDREPAQVFPAGHIVEQPWCERGEQKRHGDVDAPCFFGGVEPVEELSNALIDPGPARALP